MFNLSSRIIGIDCCDAQMVRQLYALFEKYYAQSSFERFVEDLLQKQYVILLEGEGRTVQGFSTIQTFTTKFESTNIRVIFSGDTVVSDSFWGQQQLPKAWCRLAGELKAEDPDMPLYWLLIVKGHRTFRYLSLFFNEFFPCYRQPTPVWIKSLMDQLASEKFGENYDSHTGIVTFQGTREFLKQEWLGLSDSKNKKLDIQFFIAKNPAFDRGDELVCLAEVSSRNLRSFARTYFLQGLERSMQVLTSVSA